MAKVRLAKKLAWAGIASRRRCEKIIFENRVTVNGEPVSHPHTMVDDTDEISVDGKPIPKTQSKVYFILNKPSGVVCSNQHSRKSRRVVDFFEDIEQRLFTVGRLDKDTTGLIIVTNDGDYAHHVIHPSSNIQKEYLAKTYQEITDHHLKLISKGVTADGVFVKPVKVRKVRKGTLKVTVKEGKRHEVRKMVEAAGLKIRELTRIRIGGLVLGPLPVGHWRQMTEREKTLIFE